MATLTRSITMSIALSVGVFAQSNGFAESVEAIGDGSADMSISSDGSSIQMSASDERIASSFAGTSKANQGDSSLAAVHALKESASEFAKLLAIPAIGDPKATIFLPDTRTRVNPTTTYPARATVLVTSSAGRCSGWMIGANTVATAGHCVHGGRGGRYFTNVVVYPGRNGPLSPYGSCRARTLYTVQAWIQNSDDRYDYGAIKLNCTIGNTTGWYGFFWTTTSLTGFPTTINGYPGDKPLQQWRSTGRVTVTDTFRVFYRNDMINGDSGAPVYYNRSRTCNPCTMAINAYNVYNGPPFNTNNHGTRIRQAVFNNLIAWRNAR